MLYFDPEKPNKYAALKKELVPHDLYDGYDKINKKKFGKGDGGYVLGNYQEDFFDRELSILSYGVGDDPLGVSFEQSFSDLPVNICHIHLYDYSIEDLPASVKYGKFFKEHLTKDNFSIHVRNLPKYPCGISILKMDVEGAEYNWLTKENLEILGENFDQFTLEVHGLIEEVPDNWIIEPAIQNAKGDLEKKVNFFKMLNEKFYLFHIHGNNHAPRYVDFPDSLELTYINKKVCRSEGVSQQRCPDLSVDEPNFDGRPDFVCDWWI